MKLAKTVFDQSFIQGITLEGMIESFQYEGFTKRKAVERITEIMKFRNLEVNEKGEIIPKTN